MGLSKERAELRAQTIAFTIIFTLLSIGFGILQNVAAGVAIFIIINGSMWLIMFILDYGLKMGEVNANGKRKSKHSV